MEAVLEPTNGVLQLASFRLASEEYAIDIASIQEIVRMSKVTRVPCAPAYLEGIVNLRGKIVPVLDLRKCFNMAPIEPTKATRIIIVEVAGKTIGLIVDAVREVLRLGQESVDSTPEMVSNGLDEAFFKGVGKLEDRLIILLDLAHLLRMGEVPELGALAS